MQRVISVFLVLMLVFPAVVPWLPHDAMHAVHDSHVSAHHGSGHHHNHVHDHKYQHQTNVHHTFHLDFISYFQDYLHVDLTKPEQPVIDLPIPDTQSIDHSLESLHLHKHYALTVLHSRAPPDYQRQTSAHTPIYLSTQRLRI